MKRIGILFGMEQSFPAALVQHINSLSDGDVCAEFVRVGGIKHDQVLEYDVVLDRISQDIPFYRTMLKTAALQGVKVLNNPFWWSADDGFFQYSLARSLGIDIPNTVMIPTKEHPRGTTSESHRNMIYPLNWERIFEHTGFPAYMKPVKERGRIQPIRVHSEEEFFEVYDTTGDNLMLLQQEVPFEAYFRCYAIGKDDIRIIPFDPHQPHHFRYDAQYELSDALATELRKLCTSVLEFTGYHINCMEFAIVDGKPIAIDLLNPAPDSDGATVGNENANWMVEKTAELLISHALTSSNQSERPSNQSALFL